MRKIYELQFENPKMFFSNEPSIIVIKSKKKTILYTHLRMQEVTSKMHSLSEAIYFMKVIAIGYKNLYPNMKITFSTYLLNKKNKKLKIMSKEIKAEN